MVYPRYVHSRHRSYRWSGIRSQRGIHLSNSPMISSVHAFVASRLSLLLLPSIVCCCSTILFFLVHLSPRDRFCMIRRFKLASIGIDSSFHQRANLPINIERRTTIQRAPLRLHAYGEPSAFVPVLSNKQSRILNQQRKLARRDRPCWIEPAMSHLIVSLRGPHGDVVRRCAEFAPTKSAIFIDPSHLVRTRPTHHTHSHAIAAT